MNTIELQLTDHELSAIEAIGTDLEISNAGVVKMAIRWFQLFHLGVYNFIPNGEFSTNQVKKMADEYRIELLWNHVTD